MAQWDSHEAREVELQNEVVTLCLVKPSGRGSALLLTAAIFLATLTGSSPSSAAQVSFSGARPFTVFVPSAYDPSRPAPLILALHGYNSSGLKLEKYLNLTAVAKAKGFLYIHPDGVADKAGIRSWNATPECCDFHSPKIDDEAYLMKIIDEVSKAYSVDPNRIYIIGHSNGGFMANRMACDHADRIAAIVNLAGGSFVKQASCKPAVPISILQIWGTDDETYKGNHILGKPIPGAVKTIANWGSLDRCSKNMSVVAQKMDLEAKLIGDETTVSHYTNCAFNADVEFWSIAGAGHEPSFSQEFSTDIVDFLLAHPKKMASIN